MYNDTLHNLDTQSGAVLIAAAITISSLFGNASGAIIDLPHSTPLKPIQPLVAYYSSSSSFSSTLENQYAQPIYSNDEKVEIVDHAHQELATRQQDLDPNIERLLSKNFLDLI